MNRNRLIKVEWLLKTFVTSRSYKSEFLKDGWIYLSIQIMKIEIPLPTKKANWWEITHQIDLTFKQTML